MRLISQLRRAKPPALFTRQVGWSVSAGRETKRKRGESLLDLSSRFLAKDYTWNFK